MKNYNMSKSWNRDLFNLSPLVYKKQIKKYKKHYNVFKIHGEQ